MSICVCQISRIAKGTDVVGSQKYQSQPQRAPQKQKKILLQMERKKIIWKWRGGKLEISTIQLGNAICTMENQIANILHR